MEFYIALKELDKLGTINSEIPIEKYQIKHNFQMTFKNNKWHCIKNTTPPQIEITAKGKSIITK